MKEKVKFLLGFIIGFGLVLATLSQALAKIAITAKVNEREVSTKTLEAPGVFRLSVPLERNRVNQIYIRVRDENGQEVVKGPFQVTQLTLDKIVVAKATSERLSTEEVEELVQQGVIDLKDPENWNVSRFTVQLNIAQQPVTITRTIAVNKNDPEEVYEERGGRVEIFSYTDRIPELNFKIPKIEIEPVIVPPPKPYLPPIPAFLVIDGRIKTLKEFFKVKLLIVNTSDFFTLKDIGALINIPSGVTLITPENGRVLYAEIGPQSQDERQWIVRGDKIGHYNIKLDFSGYLTGPGIPEPVPISGSAQTSIDVKGPPQLKVFLEHPSYIEKDKPYEIYVHITNIDDIPAHYASLTLTLGGEIGWFEEREGSLFEHRELGHILPGQTVVQSFTIYPQKSGLIQSCVSAATSNIQLFVQAGDVPCPAGTIPYEAVQPSEKTTVWVVPGNNASDVDLNTRPVVYFSHPVEVSSLTTGFEGASILVADEQGNIVPGELRKVFEDPEGTVGIAFFHDEHPFEPGTTYYVVVSDRIIDAQGRPIASGLTSSFTTRKATWLDTTPPQVELTWAKSYETEQIIPGQLLEVQAFAGDESGIDRVECYLDGSFKAVDSSPPYVFALDTTGIAPNARHTILVRAYDTIGNFAEASLDFWTTDRDTRPPEITKFSLSPDPVLKGQKLALVVEAQDDSPLAKARFYLDNQASPFLELKTAPFVESLDTEEISAGEHRIRVVVEDAYGNAVSQEKSFSVQQDTAAPEINIKFPQESPQIMAGDYLNVNLVVEDNVRVSKLEVFLDDNPEPLTTEEVFSLSTKDMDPGEHRLLIRAYDESGNVRERVLLFTVVPPPPPDTTPPELKADLIKVTFQREDAVAISGQPGATEGLALVEVLNQATGEVFSTRTDGAGAFYLVATASPGAQLAITATDAAGNQSSPVLLELPAIEGLEVSPQELSFVDQGQRELVTAKWRLSDGSLVPCVVKNLSFEVEDSEIASVSSDGWATALANGETTLHVRHVSGYEAAVSITINIRQPVGLSFSVESLLFKEAGERKCVSLWLNYSDGSRRSLYQGFDLAISDPNLVAQEGLCFTALKEGEAVVEARYGDFSATLALNVHFRRLDHLEVEPQQIKFTRSAQKQALQIVAVYDDGLRRYLTSSCAFVSSDPEVAVVGSGGVVVAGTKEGTAEITATCPEGEPLSIPVELKFPEPVALLVSPSWVHFTALGETITLDLNYRLSDGSTSPAPAEDLRFVSADEDIATVDAHGVITAVNPGQTTIQVEDRVYGLSPVNITVVVEPEGAIPEEAPELHYLSWYKAARGDLLGLAGENFSVYPSFDHVYIGGYLAEVVKALPSYLVVRVPGEVPDGEVEVYVEVGGRETEHKTLYILAHEARAIYLGGPIDMSGVDMAWTLWQGKVWFEPGDKVYLSRAVNQALVPEIEGRLYVKVNGILHEVETGGTQAPELSAYFVPGWNQVEVILNSSEIISAAEEIATVTVPATAMPTEDAGLTDGTPPVEAITLSAGEKIVLYAEGLANWRDAFTGPEGGGAIGPICGTKPYLVDGPILRLLGNFNGELYDFGAGPVVFTAPEDGTLYLGVNDCLFADNTGSYTVHIYRVETGQGVRTGTLYLLYGPPETGVLAGKYRFFADGLSHPYHLVLEGLRDLEGHPVPEGTKVAVTARSGCSYYDLDGDGDLEWVGSAGGEIIGGEAATGGQCYQYARIFTVQGGRVEITYSPVSVAPAKGETKIARLQVLPVDENGRVQGTNALKVVELALGNTSSGTLVPTTDHLVAGSLYNQVVGFAIKDLRDAFGNPVPEGTKVAVTARSGCSYYDLDGDGDLEWVGSAGGEIIGGEAATGGQCYQYARIFTVQGGEAQGEYSAAGLDLSGLTEAKVARLQVLPATGTKVLGSRAVTVTPLYLLAPDPRSAQAEVLPETLPTTGVEQQAVITLTNLKDIFGAPVPDGTKVAVTARSCSWYDLDGDGDLEWVGSAGGEIIGGEAATDGSCYQYARIFTVENGKITVVYSNRGLALGTGEEKIARIQFLPVSEENKVASNRAFAVAEVRLLGPATAHISLSRNEAIAGGPQEEEIRFEISNIRDAAGNPVPEGTKVAVTARSGCSYYDLDGDGDLEWVGSAGGEIIGGEAATGGNCYQYARIFTVENGKVTGTYSTGEVDLAGQSPEKARIQVLPADQGGRILSSRALTVGEITLYPPDFVQSEVETTPQNLTAVGLDERASVVLTNLHDVLGNSVPDGTKVAVTARSCSWYDLDGDGDLEWVGSAGGEIIGGEAATDGSCYQYARIFTVENGQLNVTYSAQGIVLDVGEVKKARVQFLPANRENRVMSSRALQVAEITLAGIASGEVSLPAEAPYGSTVTFVLTNIKDALGNPVPDGTKIAVTVGNRCSYDSRSAGGEVIGGAAASEGNSYCAASEFKIFTVSGGQIIGEILLPDQGDTVTVQFLPATPEGKVWGPRAFATGVISLASENSGNQGSTGL